MTLTRARATLPGNQTGICRRLWQPARRRYGVCRQAALASGVGWCLWAYGSRRANRRWAASDQQARQFSYCCPVRLGGASWRRDFGLMLVQSGRESGPGGCAARSLRMVRSGHR